VRIYVGAIAIGVDLFGDFHKGKGTGFIYFFGLELTWFERTVTV
jgi:hypothetical protein